MAHRDPPPGFVARLKARCGSDWDCRWNDAVQRWEFVSLSAAGKPVSQFWGWFRNPLTGAAITADPVTGLSPFRDLDPAAQDEVLDNLERSFLGNRADGAGTWKRQITERQDFNRALQTSRIRAKADAFADLLKEVDLRRPWRKEHERGRVATEHRQRKERRAGRA